MEDLRDEYIDSDQNDDDHLNILLKEKVANRIISDV